MNGQDIPGAYLLRLYVCDKEMSWPHHTGETHQPNWVVYVQDSEKFRLSNVIPERIIFVSWGITVITKYRENKWVILFGPLISTRHKNWIAWTTQSKSTSSTGRSHFTHFLFALFHFKATWKFTPLIEFTK